MVGAVSPLVRRSLLGLLFALGWACDDLKDFRGNYESRIVEGNFVRSCFPADTHASLRFDPEHAVAPLGALPRSALNALTTSDGTFTDTPLEPIQNLPHDPLSDFDFPGPQRLRNYLLLARPEAGPLAGRDALVVVSLLASDSLELRIVARTADGAPSCPGAPSDTADAGDAASTSATREYFGLFRMKK